jgi:cytidine deaminase
MHSPSLTFSHIAHPAMDASQPHVSRDELITRAIEAAQQAYAPYSKFRVGAAVLTESGIVTGCNVENASYGLCLCAERSALAAAIAQGTRRFQAIAIACIDAQPEMGLSGKMPCGACRQWLLELAPTAQVFIAGHTTPFTPRELLPHGFKLG